MQASIHVEHKFARLLGSAPGHGQHHAVRELLLDFGARDQTVDGAAVYYLGMVRLASIVSNNNDLV